MNYPIHMLRVLKLDKSVFDDISKGNLALTYCVINVAVLGLLYGLSTIRFCSFILDAPTGKATYSILMVMLTGLSLSFFMHAGASLFIWVFCRGIGGTPMLMPPYLNTGVAAIALWPAAPVVAAKVAGLAHPLMTVYLAIVSIYALIVFFIAIRQAAELTRVRMGIAAAGTLMYISCFLYLWL